MYCLAWRTRRMPASSFWYYYTRREAMAAALNLSFGTRWTVRPVEVNARFLSVEV